MRWRPHVITGRREPFEDVQLGPLLGKGSYGRVYRAMWNGAPVAVKARACCWRPYLPTASPCWESAVARKSLPKDLHGMCASCRSADRLAAVQPLRSPARAALPRLRCSMLTGD